MSDRLRIGDADRSRAAEVLADHYAEGRLTLEEYDERLDAVWTARTDADLRVLFHDLPLRAPVSPPVTAGRVRAHNGGPSVWRLVVAALLALVVVGWVLSNLWIVVVAAIVALVVAKKRRHRHGPRGCAGHGAVVRHG